MHTQGATHKRRSVAIAGVVFFKGATGKAVHTQGGTPKRRYVAIAGVMLVKGPQARRYTHKAQHTKGRMWPPQESCYFRGHRQGGAHTRQGTQKTVCGHWKSHVS